LVLAQQDLRSEARSNVFLAATLQAGAESRPVRIRNISPKGALIDGADLPSPGTRVRLLRGQLSALGELTWCKGIQAGLTFDGRVDVDSWVDRRGPRGQQRVDAVVAALRSTGTVPDELADSGPPESLAVISAALDQLCERFASNADMSMEYAEDLLKLDCIAQSLRRIATGRPF
jgi:hypothetical protein